MKLFFSNEPDALTRTSGSVRGARGNPGPYRDGHGGFDAEQTTKYALETIIDNVSLLSAEALQEINEVVVACGMPIWGSQRRLRSSVG